MKNEVGHLQQQLKSAHTRQPPQPHTPAQMAVVSGETELKRYPS